MMFWIALILTVFPQEKVDKVSLENREKRVLLNRQEHTALKALPVERYRRQIQMNRRFFTDQPGFSWNETFGKADLYIGPGPDTFLIDTNFVQVGNIIIYGEGVLLVDSARLDLWGHLLATDNGVAIFRNNAHLSYKQYYYHQYLLILIDQARFEATDATIDANGIMHCAYLYDSSIFIARRTNFPLWPVQKLHDHSQVILEDIPRVGQFRLRDSCYVHLTRCDTIMVEFQAPNGSEIIISFPDYNWVAHFELSDAIAGVNGIGYKFVAESCAILLWAIETWPGCSVIVSNSELSGSSIRTTGTDTVSVQGIRRDTTYSDFRVPVYDRYFRLENTYINHWWWFLMDNTVLYMDSCEFGQMVGLGNSETYVTRSFNGGTGEANIGVVDSAFLSFTDGVSEFYVFAWNRGTLLLVNSEVTTQGLFQKVNQALHCAIMLCVNSRFDSLPFAKDTALVMFTAIDSSATGMVDTTIDIYGSAWIDVGPYNPITFDRYKLYWAYEGDSVWTLIEESTSEVHANILGTWNISGMSGGEYDLRLTIRNSAGDSLTAFRDITLLGPGTEEDNKPQGWKLIAHQDGSKLRISFSAPIDKWVTVNIFDIAGRRLRNLFKGKAECQIDLTYSPNSGIYFIRLSGDKTITRKVVFVR